MNTFAKALFSTVIAAATGTSMAAAVTTAVGGNVVIIDYSGRSIQYRLSDIASTVSFNAGATFDGTPDTADNLSAAVGALNVVRATTAGIGGAVQETQYIESFGEPLRSGLGLSLSGSALTADNVTGELLTTQNSGGLQFEVPATRGTADGGRATISNFRFDVATRVVYADLTGQALLANGEYGAEFSAQQAFWTIGGVSGPTVIPGPASVNSSDSVFADAGIGVRRDANGDKHYTFVNELRDLRITDAGMTFLSQALGLRSTGINAFSYINNEPGGWGTVRQSMTLTLPQLTPSIPAIPEPSTFMLASGGLALGALLTSRHRRKACQA
ncbi:MAG: PEP-CTERM sorting domain-containing protein [Rubrivivax sp.]|nr:MAG: PEP-CTERM sorting domain-containing protein [Rubrivivax sp.]